MYDDYYDYDSYHDAPFADPGGNSALRAGPRIYACPTCGAKNRLSAEDKKRGYQCDPCADREERGGY